MIFEEKKVNLLKKINVVLMLIRQTILSPFLTMRDRSEDWEIQIIPIFLQKRIISVN